MREDYIHGERVFRLGRFLDKFAQLKKIGAIRLLLPEVFLLAESDRNRVPFVTGAADFSCQMASTSHKTPTVPFAPHSA